MAEHGGSSLRMSSSEPLLNKSKKKTKWKINKEMLPYKIHFFVFFGAMSGVMPFIAVFAKTKLGISASVFGVIMTIQQFLIILTKFSISAVTDYFNKLKLVIITLSILQTLLYMVLLFIPRMPQTSKSIQQNNLVSSWNLNKNQSTYSIDWKCENIDDNDFVSSFDIDNYVKKGLNNKKEALCHTNDDCTVVLCYNTSFSTFVFIRNITKYRNFLENVTRCQYYINTTYFINESNSDIFMKIDELVKHEANDICCNHLNYVLDSLFSDDEALEINKMSPLFMRNCNNTNENINAAQDNALNCVSCTKCRSSNLTKTDSSLACRSLLKSLPKSKISMKFIIITSEKDDCFLFKCNYTLLEFNHLLRDEGILKHKNVRKKTLIYHTYQFWIFCCCLIMASVFNNALITLSDTACHESLQNTGADYGKQRCWGTISWGVIAALAGLLNDVATGNSTVPDFSPGWYIMFVLTAVQVINISRLDLLKPDLTSGLFKNIKTVFGSLEFCVFETAVFINGTFTGVTWFYLAWFLATLGGSQLLLGLVQTAQCFLGEGPLLYASGWMIRKFGYMNMLTLTFLATFLRFISYSYLRNPWFALPIESLHGVTYGVFYSTMSCYGKMKSRPGTEATTQAILCSTYEGLGAGVGCIFAGFGFDYIGAHNTFFVLAICSLGAAVIQAFVNYLLLHRTTTVVKDYTIVD